jgi:saccharopine dehydrogenase-like NADP-dependent oxidoreductase
MKVVVIGAGEQGYVLTWNLVKHPAVTEIVIADSDEQRARDVASRVGDGKASAVVVNAQDV